MKQTDTPLPAPTAIVVGAGSAIARALLHALAQPGNTPTLNVIAITRDTASLERDLKLQAVDRQRIEIIASDYSQESMQAVTATLKHHTGHIHYLFICNGILHGLDFRPEKSFKQVKREALEKIFCANTFIPFQWLSTLAPLLPGQHPVRAVVLSARVGSISDNRLGGWYGYRASKAALNMLLKTAAIELWRTAKNVKLIAFHPGTVDTPLSKPFQKGVPEGKLFHPDFVAAKLLSLCKALPLDGELAFLDWAGKPIEF